MCPVIENMMAIMQPAIGTYRTWMVAIGSYCKVVSVSLSKVTKMFVGIGSQENNWRNLLSVMYVDWGSFSVWGKTVVEADTRKLLQSLQQQLTNTHRRGNVSPVGRLELSHIQQVAQLWQRDRATHAAVEISDGIGRRVPTTVRVRKLKWLPFRAVSKYPQNIVWFCYKSRVWQTDERTDGRTDGQNYDCQDRASIAASRGKYGILPSGPSHFLDTSCVLPHSVCWHLTRYCVICAICISTRITANILRKIHKTVVITAFLFDSNMPRIVCTLGHSPNLLGELTILPKSPKLVHGWSPGVKRGKGGGKGKEKGDEGCKRGEPFQTPSDWWCYVRHDLVKITQIKQ